MKKIFHIALVVSILCSCEVDVSDKFSDQQNLFVVSGQVIAGEAPRINLSRTITMAEVDTLLYLNDAIMDISLGEDSYIMDPAGDGFYQNENLIPEAGGELILYCTGEGLPPATVSLTIPEYPRVTDIRLQVDDAYNFTLDVDIEDPAHTMDYYSFYLSGWRKEVIHSYDWETEEETVDTSNVFRIYDVRIHDLVIEYTGGPRQFEFYDLSEPGGQYFHFSDKLISGSKHTLTVNDNLRYFYNDSIPEIYVNIIKRDDHYFRFLESYIHYDPYPAQDFLQAVQVYSNVDGGFGLLTSESRVVDTLYVSEWYEELDSLLFLGL